MRWLRRWFLAGLVVLLPLIVTYWALAFAFNLLDGLWRSVVPYVLGTYVPGVGALLTLGLTVAVGVVATNVIGRRLIAWGERLLERIPLVRSVYTTTKQIVDMVAGGQRGAFQRVVLVEYPRRGTYSLGFLAAAQSPGPVQDAVGEELWSVFVPTAPNPTTGWVVILPRSQCRVLDMSIEDAFRYVISGGVLARSNGGESARGGSGTAPALTGRPTGSS